MTRWLSRFGQKIAQFFRPFWRETLFGLFMQVSVLAVYMLILTNTLYFPDYNDWAELVYLGVQNLVSGVNPYGKTYVLGIALTEPRNYYEIHSFLYGPVTLIAHLPILLFPFRFDGLGLADIMPSFIAMQVFFTFLMFCSLARAGHARFGLAFWGNPLFIPFEAGTFFALPMLFVLLGLQQIQKPQRCIFWLSLAAATYHLTAPLLLFAMVYHHSKVWAVLRGIAPVVALTSAFVLWSALEGHPLQLLQDLLLSQLNRPYMDWSTIQFVPTLHMMASIPVILYNVFGVDFVSLWTAGALRMSSLMLLGTLALTALLCIRLALYPSIRNAILYGSVTIWLLILSMPYGLMQYYVILVFPVFFLLRETGLWTRFALGLGGRFERLAASLGMTRH